MYAILIPAYQPDATLTALAVQLQSLTQDDRSFSQIVIVDDGSTTETAHKVFDHLRTMESVTVLAHAANMGKGAALKTGLSWIASALYHVDLVITADADGQHAPEDILRVAAEAINNRAPVIGARRFGLGVPLRSRFGNLVTRAIFRLFSGVGVSDTQSGLRAYVRCDFDALIAISDTGYEFEFQALFLIARKWKGRLREIIIQTIYEPGNPTSHFNPIADSLKIYAVLLRHMSVSAMTTFADFVIFSLLSVFPVATLPALVISRLIVTPYYFLAMRAYVFKSDENATLQAVATLALIVLNVIFLWAFIDALHALAEMPRSIAMALGIMTFYALNFFIQKYLIFR